MPASKPKLAHVGRPRSAAATSHRAIMDAVYALLQEMSARDLTMQAVAQRAGVGKPTLYKWWPSKAALILAMFHERLVEQLKAKPAATVEATLRVKMRHLIRAFNGQFGKVMSDLIAEGQSDPSILHELYDHHISVRRAEMVADIERGKTNGEFHPDTDSELLVDALVAPIYFRLLFRLVPLTEQYVDELMKQLLQGIQIAAKRR
jgi:AcrR family transcriptional regulator